MTRAAEQIEQNEVLGATEAFGLGRLVGAGCSQRGRRGAESEPKAAGEKQLATRYAIACPLGRAENSQHRKKACLRAAAAAAPAN
jgi:hypothetical protein